MDLILTGASRGIGLALARALPSDVRLHAVARDRAALDELARRRGNTVVHAADLSSLSAASALGDELTRVCAAGATLVHNAGIWPIRREMTDGLESAFLVNFRAPLALQAPLLAARKLARVLVVGAGLM